jgi:hypothetical protein
MGLVQIEHKALGATAEVDEAAVPGWAEVGWSLVTTDAEGAAVPATQPKKQPTKRAAGHGKAVNHA